MNAGTPILAFALVLVSCMEAEARADTPVAPPLPVQPLSEPVPVSALKGRPQFISGTMPDTLPDVIEAGKNGRSGRVVVEAIVTPDGTLAEITVPISSGLPKLDAAIVSALKTWRLTVPIDRNGARVSTRAKFPFQIGQPPARLSGPDFAWPSGAREAYHNGKVTVKFTIGADGVPGTIAVSKSSGSSLLDSALVSAVTASRFEPPKALDGSAKTFDAAMTWEFSQADAGAGSYIEGMRIYSCRTFIGEHDWRAANVPADQINDTKFYHFMGGVAFVAPDALGWKNVSIMDLNSRHKKAWENALDRCRAKPDSTFLAEYRKG